VVTAARFFDNYGTGAPGFNRERSVALPAIAVDRTRGPHRGRIYVAWNESFNWYDDAPTLATPRDETEPNEWFAAAMPFTPGETLAGSFADTLDFDYFSFSATRAVPTCSGRTTSPPPCTRCACSAPTR